MMKARCRFGQSASAVDAVPASSTRVAGGRGATQHLTTAELMRAVLQDVDTAQISGKRQAAGEAPGEHGFVA